MCALLALLFGTGLTASGQPGPKTDVRFGLLPIQKATVHFPPIFAIRLASGNVGFQATGFVPGVATLGRKAEVA